MIRWSSIVLISLITISDALGQDLYSFNNSMRFADHLYKEGEFEAAANEYSRAIFLNDECGTCYINYVISLRKSEQLEKAINTLSRLSQEDRLNGTLGEEWLKIYTIQSDLWSAQAIVEGGLEVDANVANFFLLALSLKTFDLPVANQILVPKNQENWKYKYQSNKLTSIREKANQIKF